MYDVFHLCYRATMKAVEAAIQSRQWNKAIQILQVVGDGPKVEKYFAKIAAHYSNIGKDIVAVIRIVCYKYTNTIHFIVI